MVEVGSAANGRLTTILGLLTSLSGPLPWGFKPFIMVRTAMLRIT